MAYLFRCPVRDTNGPRWTRDTPPHMRRIMGHFAVHGGYPVAVLITDGVVTEKTNPTQDECLAADSFYLGGYDHYIDDATATVLTAAGYGAQIELYPLLYGGGGYGEGAYGL